MTGQGLLSKEYKDKLSRLLYTFKDGYKNKLKYFKNSKGEMIEELAVPEIVLFFDEENVKDLVYMVKNSDNPDKQEEFKKYPQRLTVMNQVIIGCRLLSKFAKESKNNISEQYDALLDSIGALGAKDPEIRELLNEGREDEISRHMKYLIEEFKTQEGIK